MLNKSILAVTYLPVIFQVLTNSLADYCSSTFPGTEVKIIPLQIPDTFFFLNIGSIFAKIQPLEFHYSLVYAQKQLLVVWKLFQSIFSSGELQQDQLI